jgi:hypothetical protein
MKKIYYYATAAAVAGAPVGWFVGGFLAAQRLDRIDLAISSSFAVSRPIYLQGSYPGHALAAAVLAAVVVSLAELGRGQARQ